jgi:hypothetical protein
MAKSPKKKTEKRLNSRDPDTWLKPHWGVSRELADRAAKMPGFIIGFAMDAVRTRVNSYEWSLKHLGESATPSREDLEKLVVTLREETVPEMIKELSTDRHAPELRYRQLIEKCILADRLEEMLKK